MAVPPPCGPDGISISRGTLLHAAHSESIGEFLGRVGRSAPNGNSLGPERTPMDRVHLAVRCKRASGRILQPPPVLSVSALSPSMFPVESPPTMLPTAHCLRLARVLVIAESRQVWKALACNGRRRGQRDQQVERDVPDLRRPDFFHVADRSGGQDQADGHHEEHGPRGIADEGYAGYVKSVLPARRIPPGFPASLEQRRRTTADLPRAPLATPPRVRRRPPCSAAADRW